ncbi:hypothetical protein L9F63_002431 [Diploptera punctata]|uniref:Uncharacterized protein n=1 Tax=Diploptera punctata TaxID=6984 RepID=A0AAD8EDF5_DIPPU|nr:hypothetical protein L9F63_002431 [Diploptera punctata]
MKTYSRKKSNLKCEFEDTPMNFNEICRLCLSEEGEKYSLSHCVDDVPLSIRIMACISLEMYEGDGLPSHICHQCAEEVESYYKFKQKCQTSDARLRLYLKNVGAIHDTLHLPQTTEMRQDANTLFCQEDQDEQTIINNIREDLENHENMPTIARPIEQNLEYTEMTGPNDNIQQASNEGQSEKKFETLVSMKKELQGDNFHGQEQKNITVIAPVSNPEVQLLTNVTSQFDQNNLPFICDKCPKRFAKRIDLRRHESVHNQQRGFECPICEKWFPNKTSFGRHERTHTGERPFSCEHCGKSFSQGAILARHVMTHTGMKPFKCDVCNKGFTQREGLRVHIRQHTKEQQEIQLHECPLCDKAFCHPSGLSRHLIIHTGKTFDCTVCAKVFTDSSSLRRHMKRHLDAAVQTMSQSTP